MRQRLVDEQEPADLIDRVEADGRIIQKVGELHALVAQHLLHGVTRRHVLEAPQRVAAAGCQRRDDQIEPLRVASAVGDRQHAERLAAAQRVVLQAHEIDAAGAPRQRGERRAMQIGKETPECAVGVDQRVVGRQDQVRARRRFDRLTRQIDAARQQPVHLLGDDARDARGKRERRRQHGGRAQRDGVTEPEDQQCGEREGENGEQHRQRAERAHPTDDATRDRIVGQHRRRHRDRSGLDAGRCIPLVSQLHKPRSLAHEPAAGSGGRRGFDRSPRHPSRGARRPSP
ncbi:MAG: hypothetical protein KGI46_10170 [Alphaproteobacteria bacterium]|nr:hypothetical protein [Alphaproteobacteria bacterium]